MNKWITLFPSRTLQYKAVIEGLKHADEHVAAVEELSVKPGPF